jgi:hypothetical protein
MGSALKIAAVVLVVWIGFELQTNGVNGAFGGIFASANSSETEDTRSVPQRAGSAASLAHQEADERRQKMLGE